MRSKTSFLSRLFSSSSQAKENATEPFQLLKAQVDDCEAFIDRTVKLVNEWRQATLKSEEALRDLTARVAEIEQKGRPPAMAAAPNRTLYIDAIYRGLLNRDSSESERRAIEAQFEKGRSLEDIAEDIIASEEYRRLKSKGV